MTDLENFVNQSGRDKLVKDVRKKIDELGITYIYYQFVSVQVELLVRVFRQITGSQWLKKVFS